MNNFDSIVNVNTMQWFDGEENQHQSVDSGNNQLPNSTSYPPLLLGLMNNQQQQQQARLQQLQQRPDLPGFDDIDILTYLMQADNENIIASNVDAMDSSALENIIAGEIVPMPTISEQPESQPIKIEPTRDHVPPSSASDRSSPPANSPPNQDNDDIDWRPDQETLKKMTSKERRQLRNKISARNFRVRRKEYISTLEEQVRDGDDRNKELQAKNRALQEENTKLKAEIKRLRTKYGETYSPEQSAESDADTVPPITPPSSNHSSGESPNSVATTSSSFSPLDRTNVLDLDFMDLYASADATPNTFASFISQAVMPNWDVSTVLQGKPSDGTVALANANRNPANLLLDYPLLGPALMSIVVNHTFNMNYTAFSMGHFPYNEPLPAYQDTGLAVSDIKRNPSLSPGLDDLSSDELGLLWDVLNKRYQTALEDTENPDQEEELRNLSVVREKLLKQRKFRATRELFWNTVWKLQGLSPEEIKEKYNECLWVHAARELAKQEKIQKKAACTEASCSQSSSRLSWADKKRKLPTIKIRLF